MNRLSQILIRPWYRILGIVCSSAVGGYAYRSSLDNSDEASQLNPRTFVPFTLVSKDPVSATSSVFKLRQHGLRETRGVHEAWARGVWSVQAKQPQLQIARSYTPLPREGCVDDYHATDGELSEELRLLIRREEVGEVSRYLHQLPEQSTVELRGPHLELDLPGEVKEVLFLAGGTGIAPAMQVAALLARRLKEGKEDIRMYILWANRHREDCMGGKSNDVAPVPQGKVSGWRSLCGLEKPVVEAGEGERTPRKASMVAELERLSKNFGGSSKMNVEYFVDDERKFIQRTNVLQVLQYGETENALAPQSQTQQPEQPDGKKLIIVSGPDGFIEHWAGKKIWVAGRETQGVLGGVLGGMNLQGWKVWKL